MPRPSDGPAIEFKNVSKRFHKRERMTLPGLGRWQEDDTFFAVRDVDFRVERGERVGIVGRNGSGKSTILQLIVGILGPTSGEVIVRGRISPLLQLGAGFQAHLSGRENVFLNGSILGLSTAQIRERFDDIVAFAELEEFMETPLKHYSSGMHARLGFAVAVHCEPDIMLLDEVLAVGDAPFRAKCEERMRKFEEEGVTMVTVSHSLEFVSESCHRALLIDHGRLLEDGPAADVVEKYRQTTGATPSDDERANRRQRRARRAPRGPSRTSARP